ncbi:MAG: iron-containing alcohol dehydrogenase [Thiotrichales bacterium]|nr:iron-containing alcohol dehydrogenase [Thiotrichales bacterium]
MHPQSLSSFEIAPIPHLYFGWGIRHQLLQQLEKRFQGPVVLICSHFLAQEGQFGWQLKSTLQKTCQVQTFTIRGEPSPETVDQIVAQCQPKTEVLIALGGGSVLDAGKAIAGLIPSQNSVLDYLEGVGAGKSFTGPTCPFIAIPTTAGTGSETTKNAVLSRVGQFKKSFRDNQLLAKEAWLDPELLETCPKSVLYATGMDAFTQLLESYVTLKANPITDALAWRGMTAFLGAFDAIDHPEPAETHSSKHRQQGLSNLMLAASLSGTTLANAGLGAVHGLAGPIGAFFDAPHGVVCAKLLAPITIANLQALNAHPDASFAATFLEKYAAVGRLVSQQDALNTQQAHTALITYLQQLTATYVPQGLASYGLRSDNLEPILASCRSGSMLGNPTPLSDETLRKAIQGCL